MDYDKKDSSIMAEELLKVAEKYPNLIKISKMEKNKQNNLQIIDISIMKNKENKDKTFNYEDKIYREFEEILKIIRRGNTILKTVSGELMIVRKGLRKFFNFDKIDNESNYVPNKDFELTFQELKETNLKIKVYKMEKANGKNCQISYNKKYDLWFIASKNKCIAVNNKKELSNYCNIEEINGENDGIPDEEGKKIIPYKEACLIALKWFEILEKTNEIIELKNELENKCLIGEYCKKSKNQHIVRYEEDSIKFFAIVDINSYETCIPPQIAFNFFKKYQFNTVKEIDEGFPQIYDNFNHLFKELNTFYNDIYKSDIGEAQEGKVLYFVGIDSNLNEIKVFSLCKIKTFEYKYFRIVREILDSSIKFKKKKKFTMQEAKDKFRKEIKDLIDLLGENYDPKIYYLFADYSIDCVEKIFYKNLEIFKIEEKFNKIIYVFLNCIVNDLKFDIKMIQNDKEEKININQKWKEFKKKFG